MRGVGSGAGVTALDFEVIGGLDEDRRRGNSRGSSGGAGGSSSSGGSSEKGRKWC